MQPPAPPETRELLAALAAGAEAERRAFSLFWAAFRPRLLLFAAAFPAIPASEREDAVQEAVLKAWSSLDRLDPERPLAPWVFTVARNLFRDLSRSRRRRARLEHASGGARADEDEAGLIDKAADPAPGPEELLVAKSREGELQAAMRAIAPEDRALLRLRYGEGFDSREIGRIFGLPAGSVRWRLKRARERLAELLGEDT